MKHLIACPKIMNTSSMSRSYNNYANSQINLNTGIELISNEWLSNLFLILIILYLIILYSLKRSLRNSTKPFKNI